MSKHIKLIGIVIIVMGVLGGLYQVYQRYIGVSTADLTTPNSMPVYQNTAHNFSFSHPETVTVDTNRVEDGDMIIVSDSKTSSIFQIYIKSIAQGQVDITEERLRADIPELQFRDPQDVEITSGAKGLAFISKDTDGEKREVWFTFNNFLYQLSAPLDSDDFLKNILNTWAFKKI